MAAPWVAGNGVGEGVLEAIEARGEVPELFGLAVEGDEGDAVGGASHHGFEQGGEVAVVLELARSVAAGLHQQDDGERLPLDLLDREALLDAVVGEAEVAGREVGYQLTGGGADERGDGDEGGGRGEGGGLVGGLGKSGCEEEERREVG